MIANQHVSTIPNFKSIEELEEQYKNRVFDKSMSKIDMLCIRPKTGKRQIVNQLKLDVKKGIIGDNWKDRGSRHTLNGDAHPEMQVTIMNSQIIDVITGDIQYWHLAGDQIYCNLDLSLDKLPVQSQIRAGSSILEVTAKPHLGCNKFRNRFGVEALRWVNSDDGRLLRLRGVNCRIIKSGKLGLDDTLNVI